VWPVAWLASSRCIANGEGCTITDPARAIDRKLAEDDHLFFVAADGDKVIGTVLAGYDGHRGWMYSLAVDPAHQRQENGDA